jgi:hypothetical protein
MKHRVETVCRGAVRAGLLGGMAAALIAGHAVAGARAPTPGASPGTPCFFITQWQGWKAPNSHTIYLGVNLHDVYRVDLSAGSPQLMWSDSHLISRVRGSDSICSAIDLQLAVAQSNLPGPAGLNYGADFAVPLIATKLTKLTPDEIAAIPKQYRPN